MVDANAGTEWPVPWQAVEGPDDGLYRRIECAVVRGALAVAARMPEFMVGWAVNGLAAIAHRVDRRHADAARAFLTQALGTMSPDELQGRVRQAYRHFLRVVLDTERFALRVPPDRVLEHFDVHWTEEARRAVESGGCVLTTAHHGFWELATFACPSLGFRPFYPVGKPPKSKPLSHAIQRSRERFGARLLPRRGAMQAAPKIVGVGGTLGLLLDQRARKRPVLAPFFGRPARCDRSAGVLLRRLGVPIVCIVAYPTNQPLHYTIEFPAVLWPQDLAGVDPAGIAARLNAVFEKMILEHPDQYFWLHDRYKDTPLEFPAEAEA